MSSTKSIFQQKPLEHRDWLSLPQSNEKKQNIFYLIDETREKPEKNSREAKEK